MRLGVFFRFLDLLMILFKYFAKGSSDSGKGGSDIHPPSAEGTSNKFLSTPLQVFEFELPQSLCGRLIGQHGRYVNLIKNRSRASISIKSHPINPDLKLCAVIGTPLVARKGHT